MNARSLLLAGIAAVLPVMAAQASGTPAPPLAQVAFVPPARPCTLTRTLTRSLHDGKQIVATRRYALQFDKVPGGYRVTATLLDRRVDAPPQLAALAAIERQRSDDEAFSLLLDAQGLIVQTVAADSAGIRPQLNQAARNAIGGSILAPPAQRQAEGMLGQLLDAMGTSALPADLFNPVAPDRRESRQIALPGGGQGEVDIHLVADRSEAGTLPRRYERTVVTTLEGSQRTTREDYAISLN